MKAGESVRQEPFDPNCRRCPRLADHLAGVREHYPDYHTAPVPTWGNRRAPLLLVGLAPGLHGANRTGRPFTGDASGDMLFDCLVATGFAVPRVVGRSERDGGFALRGCRITNAVRCLPPENRPIAAEVGACRPFLAHDLTTLGGPRSRRPRCVVALGGIAFNAVLGASGVVERIAFGHGVVVRISRSTHLIASYHPSRLNVNTGRLTRSMLLDVFTCARSLLESAKPL